MEVKDVNTALLNDFEVYQLLMDLKQQQILNTIMYKTLYCISKTPCKFKSPQVVSNFLVALKIHKLTKAEKLRLFNHRPVTAVEIQLMVEESEEQLMEEQIEALLQTMTSILHRDLAKENSPVFCEPSEPQQ
uniref:DNA-directed RNA polymerase III subunit RPC9 n=1 Tax=Anolis carolinensis TaxID=28377 RepID=A0A803TMS7_ANOCA